ncbi:mechanosensitive ion channel family protein [Reichenbachiella sp. MALMAid0571]|uniref:mechanosensitive ion channel family protein n=1 Tax=Reichenbachiella sp. MALMAid0571 TaxID=3143939 RepID=UPI0032DE8233
MILTLISYSSQAQKEDIQNRESVDSLASMQQDSLLDLQQQQSKLLQQVADSIRHADSLQQVQLLKQISDLRANDKRKRAQLEARLDSLKKNQEQRDLLVKRQVDSLRASTVGVPVVFYGDTIFYIYSKIGPFSPSERAASIVQKLEILVGESLYDPEKLIVFEGTESHDIMHEDLIILSIIDRDAFWLDKSRKEVAEEYRQSILVCVADYKNRTGLVQTLKRIGYLVLVLLIFFICIKYMNKGFTLLNILILRRGKRYITGVKFKSYEFLSIEREEQLIRWLMNTGKWFTIIIVLYLMLPVVFSIFPTTKGIASTLIGYVLNPLTTFGMAIIGYIPELITIFVILLITSYFVKFLKFISSEIETGKLQVPGFYPDWAAPTFNIVKVMVYAFAFVLIFPFLPNSDSEIFKGVSVFLGVLFSLGSSSAISNVIAGLVITYMRPFKIGDRVKIGDTVGDVLEKSMLVTRVRTIKNEDITIPNSAILNGSTINYSSSAKELGLILHASVTIGYDVPWRQVHELLINAALQTEFVKHEPKPFVLQTSLDDFYVSYQINLYTENPGIGAKIYSQLYCNIQDFFNEAGVEILSPHYRAARDGNTMAVPPDYLPSDYKVPSFNVQMKKDGEV